MSIYVVFVEGFLLPSSYLSYNDKLVLCSFLFVYYALCKMLD